MASPAELMGLTPSGGGGGSNVLALMGLQGGGYTGGGASESFVPNVAEKQKHEDHGILATIGHVLSQSAIDVKDMALGIPAGLKQIHLALAAADPSNPTHWGKHDTTKLETLGRAYLSALQEDVQHPLRHPGFTAADLLPFVSAGAGAAVRVSAASRAAALGESGAEAFLRNPAKAARVLTGPTGATAKGHYSRSGLGYASQRAIDRAMQAQAWKGGKAETLLNKRIEKWQHRQARVEEAVLNANVNKLLGAGRKLSNGESRALRFVANDIPLDRQFAADQARIDEIRNRVPTAKNPAKPGADRRTVKRLEERAQWGQDALAYLERDAQGKPVFNATPEGQKLAHVYDLMQTVVGDREAILKGLDLIDEERLHGARVSQARYAAGAKYVEPTAARLGRSPAVKAARRRVTRLEKRFDKLVKRERPGTFDLKERQLTHAEAVQHLAELTLTRDKALKDLADASFGPINKRELRDRNVERGKLRRQNARVNKSLKKRGFPPAKLVLPPTLWDERFAEVARRADEAYARNPEHPVTKRWQEREAEIERLQRALSPDPEQVFGGSARAKPDYGTTTGPVYRSRTTKAHNVGAVLANARQELAAAEARASHHLADTGVVGAEDIGPAKLFIGSPKQVRITGRDFKVSSSGTGGHTREPSLKTSKGQTVQYGMDEPNVVKILASRGKAATRLKMLARKIEVARKGGTMSPTRADDVFLWTDGEVVSQAKVPAMVKDYLTDPEAFAKTPDAAQTAFDQARQAWMQWSKNGNWQLDAEEKAAFEELARQGKGVFVQRSLLGDAGKPLPMRLRGPLVTAADATNNIQKALVVYLKANYPIVQAISNTAMNIIQQGIAAPVNIERAGRMMRKDPELAAEMGDVMGTGALMSLAGEGTSRISLGTQKLAHWMSGWVDGPARLSAFIHEASKEGFNTDAELRSLLHDEQHADKLAEVAQRAKEAIVDYSELGEVEQNLIRRMFFVYPWLKGSTKYAGHFLRDHPVQAAVLGQIGRQGSRETQALGLPSYLEGSFNVGGHRLLNPSGVNFFQTPVQIGETVAGLATGNPTMPQASGLLTPFPAMLLALATHRDSVGRPLTGGLPANLRQLLVEQTPIAQLLRASAHSMGLPTGPLGGDTPSKSFPSYNDPYGRFLFGGLYPRPYDEGALKRAAALQASGR